MQQFLIFSKSGLLLNTDVCTQKWQKTMVGYAKKIIGDSVKMFSKLIKKLPNSNLLGR